MVHLSHQGRVQHLGSTRRVSFGCVHRAPFVPQMCASLTKLGLPTNAPLENRKLALDVAALLIQWEQQRLSGLPSVPAVGLLCLPSSEAACSCAMAE